MCSRLLAHRARKNSNRSRSESERRPDAHDRKQGDEESEAEVDVVQRSLAGRVRKVNSMAMEEAEQSLFALHDEIGDRPMKSGHNQAEHQSRKISRHSHNLSVAIGTNGSIGRRA